MTDEEAWRRVVTLLENDGRPNTALAILLEMIRQIGRTDELDAEVRRLHMVVQNAPLICTTCQMENDPGSTHCAECETILRPSER